MITNSIHHQQHEQIVRNNGLRKAAKSPEPPPLTKDETSMIKKEFRSMKPVKMYTDQGKIHQHTGSGLGTNVDTKI